jgi:hypothetical protein
MACRGANNCVDARQRQRLRRCQLFEFGERRVAHYPQGQCRDARDVVTLTVADITATTGFAPQPTKAPSKSRSAVGLPQCYLPLRSTGEIADETARVPHTARRRGGEACCVKYFVIAPKSAIKQRAMPRSVNMDAALGRQRGGRNCLYKKGPALAGLSVLEERRTNRICGTIHKYEVARPLRSLCDGDHKNALLQTDCRGSDGGNRESPPRAEHQSPATVAPWRGFAVDSRARLQRSESAPTRTPPRGMGSGAD